MNDKLTSVELDLEEVQILPEREALGTFNWANVWASNTAVAGDQRPPVLVDRPESSVDGGLVQNEPSTPQERTESL
jgi:hypothetical protein